MDRGNYVYKYVWNGDIIYIGKNDTDLVSRILQHRKEQKFKAYLDSKIYYGILKNSSESDMMERLLINKYKPILNVSCKKDGLSIVFEEPEWNLLGEDCFVKKRTALFSPGWTTLVKKVSKPSALSVSATVDSTPNQIDDPVEELQKIQDQQLKAIKSGWICPPCPPPPVPTKISWPIPLPIPGDHWTAQDWDYYRRAKIVYAEQEAACNRAVEEYTRKTNEWLRAWATNHLSGTDYLKNHTVDDFFGLLHRANEQRMNNEWKEMFT